MVSYELGDSRHVCCNDCLDYLIFSYILLFTELALKSELRCTTKNHPRATGHNSRGVLIPTSVHTVLSDSKTCVVGYTNGGIAQFDFHGEQLVQFVRPTDTEGFGATSRDAQVNCIISHPTMPISITAHQDRKIRIFDMRAGMNRFSNEYHMCS